MRKGIAISLEHVAANRPSRLTYLLRITAVALFAIFNFRSPRCGSGSFFLPSCLASRL
jgi:hypothetical protein